MLMDDIQNLTLKQYKIKLIPIQLFRAVTTTRAAGEVFRSPQAWEPQNEERYFYETRLKNF